MKHILFLAGVLTIGLHANLITNGNFEAGVNPNTTKPAGSTDITGWVVLPTNVDWVGGIGTVPDVLGTNGPLYIDLNGTAQGGIQQTFATVFGQSYTVSFDMNGNTNVGASKSLQASAAGQIFTFTFTPKGATDPNWVPETFQFVATGTTTTLAFNSLVTNSNSGPLLDNVNVVASVPEPASSCLIIIGGLLLCARTEARRCRGRLSS